MNLRNAQIIGIVAATFGSSALPAPAAETASLSGYAYVCSREEALPFATVYLASPSESRVVHADKNGRFVALGLAPGSYTVALRDVDVNLAPPGVDARVARVVPLKGQSNPTHMTVSATRIVRLVPNDTVAMRIGVGANLLSLPMKSGFQLKEIACDPSTISVPPDPINRTTIVSSP